MKSAILLIFLISLIQCAFFMDKKKDKEKFRRFYKDNKKIMFPNPFNVKKERHNEIHVDFPKKETENKEQKPSFDERPRRYGHNWHLHQKHEFHHPEFQKKGHFNKMGRFHMKTFPMFRPHFNFQGHHFHRGHNHHFFGKKRMNRFNPNFGHKRFARKFNRNNFRSHFFNPNFMKVLKGMNRKHQMGRKSFRKYGY